MQLISPNEPQVTGPLPFLVLCSGPRRLPAGRRPRLLPVGLLRLRLTTACFGAVLSCVLAAKGFWSLLGFPSSGLPRSPWAWTQAQMPDFSLPLPCPEADPPLLTTQLGPGPHSRDVRWDRPAVAGAGASWFLFPGLHVWRVETGSRGRRREERALGLACHRLILVSSPPGTL